MIHNKLLGWGKRTNKMQLIWCLLSNFYFNMFRASLCPSSGEQECALPHMVFCTGCAGCGCVELGRELCALWKLTSQLHTTIASTTRYVLGLLLNHHTLYTDTTCTHPTHHLHTPLAAPNNTYITHLSSSRCKTCITTPTPNTPDRTDTWTRYQLSTTAYTHTRNTVYAYISALHTKTLRLSHLTVFFPSCYSAEHHMRQAVHTLVLLMMGIMMPETCWDRSLIINIKLVASCWFSFFTLRSWCTVTRV